MSSRAVLSSKGQLVIPKSIRNILGIHSGSELMLELRDGITLEIHPIKTDISKFFGLGKNNKISLSKEILLEEVDDLISKAVLSNDKY